MFKISKKVLLIIPILILLVSNFLYVKNIYGDGESQFYLNLDKITVSRGYIVKAFADEFKITIWPGVLTGATGVEMKKIMENSPVPWQLERLSDIYQFEFINKAVYENKKIFNLELKYGKSSNYYKQIYFYDKNYDSWRPLPSKDNPEKSTITAKINLPFARLAVFANTNVLTVGQASWYKYKSGNFAASPDFPLKSKLRVYNLSNNKFIDVEINDFGPERKLHPTRVIDLEKTAFAKLAPLGAGTINIRVEPLSVMPSGSKILGINPIGAKVEPILASKSAVLMDEQSGEIIWQKNATSTLPLASLSKLIAVKVFLDTLPTLNKVVAYSVKDENYNYQYCDKWESAKVSLKDKDTLTIENLVYSALVGSANNAIESLVRVSGLSRDNFINKMNQTVALWGATSTHFIEPTGLSPQNMSSTQDYAIITKEVFTQPIIQKASTMPEYKFSTINTKKAHRIINTNQLLRTSDLNITGSKTGYLDEALYCLMIMAKNNTGKQVIAVTFGTPTREASFSETEELLKYGFKKLIN